MKHTAQLLQKAAKLPKSAVEKELELINLNLPKPRWILRSNGSDPSTSELEGNYKLKTFAKTWQFLNTAASHAQKARHHPTIITTYNKVQFRITTHDVGNQITKNDINLARAIEQSFTETFAEKGAIEDFGGKLSSWKEASQIIDDLTKKQ